MAIKGPTTNHTEIQGWASLQGIVPVNMAPQIVDSEPARMSLLHKMTVNEKAFVQEMTWEDFFARFDLLRLTLVYDDATVFNEILQVEAEDPVAPTVYATTASHEQA
jgi:hypothetical protein